MILRFVRALHAVMLDCSQRRKGATVTETDQIVRGLTMMWSCTAASRQVTGTLFDRVLTSRGLDNPASADLFLNPTLSHLHPPEALHDLDRAVARLIEALKADEVVAIYGDYDVDGITATAILVRMCRALFPNARLLPYVPHRLDEGYGLNAGALKSLAEQGATLVVSVDCGITAVDEARVANDLGIDLIITDHHTPPATRDACPRVHSLVHPGLPWAPAPFTELCGAGVAYKLAWRLATLHCGSDRVHDNLRRLLLDLLGLAAMGAVADVVPLVDENRVMTRWGLGRVKHSPFIGIRALVEATGLAGDDIDTERVGFRLAPQLNACGRLGHAREAVELMLTDDPKRAAEIADELVRLNRHRQDTERAIVAQACELAEAQGMTGPDRRAIVLAHPDWHPGVVGIVCSRLVDRYARPAILMQNQGDVCVGSGRSIDGYNLHDGLVSCEHLLTKYGGHTMAAGLRLDSANLPQFTAAFLKHANDHLHPDELIQTASYDCDAQLHEFDRQTVEELEKLAPFGRENPRVQVRLRGVRLNGGPRTMGQHAKHLSLELIGSDSTSRRGMRAVAWGWGEHADQIPPGATIEAIVTPKLNTWNGNTKVEVELHDLRVMS